MITVIGDIIIDEYWHGTSTRLSPEAPVPVINLENTYTRLGGAGLVYSNIRNLTEDVQLIGYMSEEYKLDVPGILDCKKMPVKKRIYADGHYVTRIDDEEYINNQTIYAELKKIKNQTVVLSDYNKGTLDGIETIIRILKQNGNTVLVDPKKDLFSYRGADLIKPNKKEYSAFNSEFSSLGVQNLIVTLGEEGYKIINKDGETLVPADHKETVFDVTGAGDTFMAVLAYFIDNNEPVEVACRWANKAAGIAVKHNGTYNIEWDDLKEDSTETIVFTNGCFDILHRGHIEYLKESKKLGDKLIVGLNSDKSVKMLKGDTRPVNNQDDRKAVLEGLKFVDQVIIFDEDTPRELILKVKPDIITKGGDYTIDKVVGHELVKKTIIIPYRENLSTTNTLERIIERNDTIKR